MESLILHATALYSRHEFIQFGEEVAIFPFLIAKVGAVEILKALGHFLLHREVCLDLCKTHCTQISETGRSEGQQNVRGRSSISINLKLNKSCGLSPYKSIKLSIPLAK